VNVVIMWIGVYVHWWFCGRLRIIELCFNCMFYLLVLIHLVNSNEVRTHQNKSINTSK